MIIAPTPALPYGMPPPVDVAAVLEKLAALAHGDAWEHSGDHTLCMAIAGTYHLVVQKLFGRVSISVTVEHWKLMVQLQGATLEQGRAELCRTLSLLLAPFAVEVPAPRPDRPSSLESTLEDLGQRFDWGIPWMEMEVGDSFAVYRPAGMTLNNAHRRVGLLATARNQDPDTYDGRQFRVELMDEIITVIRTL